MNEREFTVSLRRAGLRFLIFSIASALVAFGRVDGADSTSAATTTMQISLA